MAKKKDKTGISDQVAALPVRIGIDGKPQIILVTSRETGRWVIPKGWPMRNRKKHEAAAIEAYEEAGVFGKIEKRAMGSFDYVKVMPKGKADLVCRVSVYLLNVEKVLGKWPERKERTRDFCSPIEAADRVDEPGLKEIITEFGEQFQLSA